MSARLTRWLPGTLVMVTVIAALSTAGLPARAAPASPTFTVNSTLDAVDANPGDGVCATSGSVCTLRAAIMEANHTPGGGATIIVPAGPISYKVAIPASGGDDETTGDLNIMGHLTLLSHNVVIDASLAHDRVFRIEGASVTLENLTDITNGTAATGGGIDNVGGALTLASSTVFSNAATSGSGGGLFNSGALTLTQSTVSQNSALTDGGGLLNDVGATLTISDSTISQNSATNDAGGGIDNLGQLRLTGSTINNNQAPQG